MKPLLLLPFLALPLSAATTSFTWFNGTNDTGVNITASVESGVLTISNESSLESAVVTGIWIESDDVAYIGGLLFSQDDSANLPGGVNISWLANNDSAFKADAPPIKNGIGAGEAVSFTVPVDFDDRIALHIQGVNGSSGSWVTTIPEPSCTILSALGLVLLTKRRRH